MITYIRQTSGYFPNMWPLSVLNITKNINIHTAPTAQKIKTPRHKTKRTTQKYGLGTTSNIDLLVGLNRFYRYLTSPSASVVVHNI